MKKESPQKQLKKYSNEIIKEIKMWKNQYKNGCNDPCWPDGCNLNLLRNHVISYKKDIKNLCDGIGISVPKEYFLPAPPYIDANYFANSKSERAKRIIENNGLCANTETVVKKSFDNEQMSLF